MKLCWFAALLSVAGLSLGCPQGSELSATAPGVATRPGVETLSAALSERDPLERTYLLTSFLRTMRPEDVPALLVEVEKHRVGIDAEEVRLFMLAWTRFDGPEA